jgi:hypothetical protein
MPVERLPQNMSSKATERAYCLRYTDSKPFQLLEQFFALNVCLTFGVTSPKGETLFFTAFHFSIFCFTKQKHKRISPESPVNFAQALCRYFYKIYFVDFCSASPRPGKTTALFALDCLYFWESGNYMSSILSCL